MQNSKLQFKIQNFYFLVVILSFAILAFSFNEVEAAELSLTSQAQEIAAGQQFQVDLMLDTEGEIINAIEGKITFPEKLLELKEIKDGNSIINFWIERPSLNSKSYILYSGIIPGGYNNVEGFVFSAVFEAKKEGAGVIEIRDAKILLNDGKGTAANTTISNFQFNIKDVGRPYISDVRRPEIEDTEPPEEFKPEIAQSLEMFNGEWFLVFATQDKGSGIDHYEILESRFNLRTSDVLRLWWERKWVEAESPYVLKDQKLRNFIYVKAVDKAGNERVVTVLPRYPLRWYENYLVWGIIVIGILVAGLIYWLQKTLRRNTKEKDTNWH